MGLNLFDGSDSQFSGDDISKIEIDQEFARRYDHNKRREDLHRLQELKKRGLVDDSDEESSESDNYDDLEGSDGEDLEFYGALVKVKKMDPILDEKDAKLFDSESDASAIEEKKEKKKKRKEEKGKPLYLKDVVAKHLIEGAAEFDEKEPKPKSYDEEQEEIRRSFLKAADEAFDGENDDGDGGDLLVEKKKTALEEEEQVGNTGEIEKRLDEYFGEDGNLSENDIFLKSFLKNKMWIDKEGEKKPTDEEILGVLEDEAELEKQDIFDMELQFRHEEGAGDRVLGHSRFVEGSVRKKSNVRKEQRKRKAERMALVEHDRKEELKHLKNVKKKEIEEKLEKIRAMAGIREGGECGLDGRDLEEDFDPEEYDHKMKEIFGDGYYEAEDANPDFGSDDKVGDPERPDFDKEDELLGLPKGWDGREATDGFLAVRKKIQKQQKGDREVNETWDNANKGGEDGCKDGKAERKNKISLQEKIALDKELEEYYKLDYEDTVGDLKTRFHYTSVPPNRYGLNPAELLMADDKDLNQYVSLKKLAPYRQTEWKVSKMKRYNLKVKKKLLLQGGKSNDKKVGNKASSEYNGRMASLDLGLTEKGKTHGEPNGEVGSLSRRSKRRRRQAELKLSQSRLMAYGKIPSKPKIQKKH